MTKSNKGINPTEKGLKREFVPFAIPKKEGADITETVYNYLDTWKSGEYFGWEYKKDCPTTADIWKAVAEFETNHCYSDKYIFYKWINIK